MSFIRLTLITFAPCSGKRPVLVKGSMTQLACLSRYMGNIADGVETEETYNIENPFQDNDAAKGGRIDSELIKIRMSRSLEAAKDQTLTVEDLKPLVVSTTALPDQQSMYMSSTTHFFL